MSNYTILHNGPFLSNVDIKPYITKDAQCIFSVVAGTQGQLKINKFDKLVSKNGKRIISVDFSRGVPVMIVREGKRIFVITKASYDKLTRKDCVLLGSAV